MFNALYMLLALFLVFTESMHVCNLILAHMYSMHSDLPLNPGATEARYKSSNEVNMTPRSPRTKPEKMENSEDPVRKLPNLAGQGASSNSKRN
jgi:hypothetical protein